MKEYFENYKEMKKYTNILNSISPNDIDRFKMKFEYCKDICNFIYKNAITNINEEISIDKNKIKYFFEN